MIDIAPGSDEIYGHIYTFYYWAAIPIMIAMGIVMLILRPVYILSTCDLYSDHLERKGEAVQLPENPSASVSALVAFGCLCVILAVAYLFRNELGITGALSG
jgi:hypothetical protein